MVPGRAGPGVLALDIDGTLLRSDNTLSPANAEAVARAIGNGWRVLLATGKPPWAITWLAEALDLDGPHVVANGAGVWSPTRGTEVLADIAPDDVAAGLDAARARGAPRAVSGPNGVFCEPGWGEAAVAAALADVGEDAPTLVPDVMAAEERFWKVITISPAADGDPMAPVLTTGRWVRTGPHFYEVIPAAASKAAALQRLCAEWGIPRTAVVAIGDSPNDLEILRWAGTGIAMAHAPTDVREAAARITGGNDEDGVAQAIAGLLAATAGGGGRA